MNFYYNVTVSIVTIDDKGKQKKASETYLVSAVSVTDAEAKVTNYLGGNGSTLEFEVKNVSKSKVIDVIQ